MKIKKYVLFLIAGITSLMFPACQDDYESVPLEQFTMDFVFSTTDSLGVQAKKYLNAVYSQLPNGHNRVWGDYLDAATDDAVSSALTENDVSRLALGQYTAATTIGSEMNWGGYYTGIRMATQFINNIGTVPLMDTYNNGLPLNSAWRSEARFIRAYLYFQLVKRWGGVPLLGNTVPQLGEELQVPRNTFEEGIDFIVGELDDIRDSLRIAPIADISSNGHAVTRAAAMALKTRVLLYAASPLFNGGNIDGSNPLTGYPSEDNARWGKAANAAKYFIDNYDYFGLVPNYKEVFTTYSNKEVIFARQGGNNRNVESNNGPVGFTGNALGNGRTSPSQNLVNAFPMLDGKPIGDPTSKYSYDPASMYQNRDPRLSYTVLRNGTTWLTTSLETFQGGKSNPAGALQKTKTSYYLRKFMGNFENSKEYSNVIHNWVMFRYAEVLLSFAEAQNEYAGPSDAVYQAIKDLRARAGIEEGDDGMYGLKTGMTKDEMRQAVRNERRIEMAFEEQRYWDIHRWKTAETVMNQPIIGLLIVKSGTNINTRNIEVLQPVFDKKQYLYPIPYEEVIKNGNMVQNPGW